MRRLALTVIVAAVAAAPAVASPARGPNFREPDVVAHSSHASAPSARISEALTGISSRDAAAVARGHFGPFVVPPTMEPVANTGMRVLKWLDPATAKIRTASDHVGLVRSSLPLRAPDETGALQPLDLRLQRRGADFVPENALIPVSLPATSGAPFEVGRAISARVRGTAGSSAETISERSVIYGNAFDDTDVVLVPHPFGLELLLQLRSDRSPARTELDFMLPRGTKLQMVRTRAHLTGPIFEPASVEVVKGEKTLAVIDAPAAFDAEGRRAPVFYEVDGNRLTIVLARDDEHYTYPILIDPLIQDYQYWTANAAPTGQVDPNLGYAGWTYEGNRPYYVSPTRGTTSSVYGRGLYLVTDSYDTYLNGEYGEWVYRAPRQSWIYRAEFGYVKHDPNQSSVVEGIYSTRDGRWEPGATWGPPPTPQDPNPAEFPSPSNDSGALDFNYKIHCIGPNCEADRGTPGNLAAFGLVMNAAGTRPANALPGAFMGGAVVYLQDNDAPTFDSFTQSSAGWSSGDVETVAADTRDAGLGMSRMFVDAPGWSGPTAGGYCTGQSSNYSDCPETMSMNTSYYSGSLAEGINTVTLHAKDILDHETTRSWEVRIDRSNPSVDGVSGPLWDQRNQSLSGDAYNLTANATDGDGSNPATARSGVTSLTFYVDGEEDARFEQACPDHSCPMQRTWTFRPGDYGEGQHSIEVVAEDQVGREGSLKFNVTTKCCLVASSPWTGMILNADTALGDVNADGLSDLIIRDRALGSVQVALSQGNSFATAVPWGSWSTVYSLNTGDVDGDGYTDLVGVDAVGGVYVGRSNGSTIAAPQQWGITSLIPAEHLFADIDGDGATDLVNHLPTGAITVAYSDGGAFEPEQQWGAWPVEFDLQLADATGDGAADFIGRNSSTGEIGVAESTGGAWGPLFHWATVSQNYEIHYADMNADGSADMVAIDPTDGTVYVAESSETYGFVNLRTWGNWLYNEFRLADITGDGKAELAGPSRINTELYVGTNLATTSIGQPAFPGFDDTSVPVDSTRALLDPGEVVASSASNFRLISEDNDTLLYRRRLGVADPFGADNQAAEDRIRTILSNLKNAGVTGIRFLVDWGRIERSPIGSNPLGGPIYGEDGAQYAWDHLDRAIRLVRGEGMKVYLTLTGVAADWDCASVFTATARGCAARTGIAPADRGATAYSKWINDYQNFVAATVQRYSVDLKDAAGNPLVSWYSLWNEPNIRVFLQPAPSTTKPKYVVPSRIYRDLYDAGYSAATAAYPSARIVIGELSELTRSGFLPGESTTGRRHRISSLDFLEDVVRTGSRVSANAAAFHPYQHRQPASRRESDVTGIGKTNIGLPSGTNCATAPVTSVTGIKQRLCRLYKLGYLRTPGNEQPPVYFTEFGYFNRPLNEAGRTDIGPTHANTYWHTERTRANWFGGTRAYKGALDKALGEKVRMLNIYHAVEFPPEHNSSGDIIDRWDSGLFAADGTFTGERPYGKDTRAKSPDYRTLEGANNTQCRMAYATIRRWAWKNHLVGATDVAAPKSKPPC